MKTYSVTHTAGRASIITADLDAVVQAVNNSVMGDGTSINRAAVERELDRFDLGGTRKYFEIVETEFSE